MQPTAFLVNTAHGPILEEDALYDALAAGRIAGAGLDVHGVEPRPKDDRFCALPNVRVALAATFVYGPRIPLADEPFSALDVRTRNMTGNELLDLWRQINKTVVFVTHDLEEAIAPSSTTRGLWGRARGT